MSRISKSTTQRLLQSLLYWLRGDIRLGAALQGILLVAEENGDRKLSQATLAIRAEINNGSALSQSLRPFIGQDDYVLLLLGERFGVILPALERIVATREQAAKALRLLLSKLVYPVSLLVFSGALLTLISQYLFPQLLQEQMDSTLQAHSEHWRVVTGAYLLALVSVMMVVGVVWGWRQRSIGRGVKQTNQLLRTSLALYLCESFALSFQGRASFHQIVSVLAQNASVAIQKHARQMQLSLQGGERVLERIMATGLFSPSALYEIQLLRKEGKNQQDMMLKIKSLIWARYETQRLRQVNGLAYFCYFFAVVNIALIIANLAQLIQLTFLQFV